MSRPEKRHFARGGGHLQSRPPVGSSRGDRGSRNLPLVSDGRGVELEFHQLDLRHEGLHLRRPDKERRLLGSLSAEGQQVPIAVVAGSEAGRYVVVDGFKRCRGLRRLRQDTVRATVWDLGEAEALLLVHALRADESATPLEQAWLLRTLSDEGLSREDLALRFSRSQSWVSRRLGLASELPLSVQEQVREGRISSHAVMKYLLPMARAKVADSEALAAVAAKEKLTSREVGDIYAAWRDGSPAYRRRLLREPQLFLKTRRELVREAVSASPVRDLMRDLEGAAALSRRACRRWSEAVSFMGESEREEARRCAEQAIADLTRLRKRMEGCGDHAQAGHTDGHPGASRQGGGQEEDRAPAGDLEECGRRSDRVEVGGGADPCPQ
jgi:ParB/RepB/Spo0J family partition protein